MKNQPLCLAGIGVLVLLLTLPARVQAAPPDLTVAGTLVDTTNTYNLGPTGARGWIYSTGNEWMFTPETLTSESRQIKVTQIDAGSPAAGQLLVNDVILGASGTASAPVAFTSDARKSLGLAVGEAEKSVNAGVLKLLVWRGGALLPSPVQLTLQVMGSYSATAPFSCPKSSAIITKACTLLASHSINSGYTEGNAVIGLALLACVSPTDAYYATVQSKVQTYARLVASQNLSLTIPLNQMVAWPWGYNNVFLSEYYLATLDAQVLPAIRKLTAICATGQSLFGTYGHGMAWSKSDGSSTHGYVPPYGPVNQAGETVNLGIMLGRKALAVAGDATIDPEIEPAITRARKYFGYFAGKGAVPYGHSPPEDLHDDNGKNGLATLLMALQSQEDMSSQAQYFAKSCTAAYNLREMGHCGPYWAHLWQPLGVNAGGPTAMAAYFQQIEWELDLVRCWDGSFAYHSATGAKAGTAGLGTDSDTACFLLTYATALKKIYLTGKSQSAANYISAADVSEAITDGVYSLRNDLTALTSDQLIACLGSWSSQKRNWASAELAKRSDASTKVATLLTMAADSSNLNARKGACQALGQIKPTAAASVLRDRLNDTDYHVRYYAADALKNLGSAASAVLSDMLTSITANAQPVEPINWADPYQIAYGDLGSAAFEGQLGNSISGVSTSLLYPAITAMSQSLGRGCLANTLRNALSLANVQALAPTITTALLTDHTICQGGLANACVSVLSKYNIDEGIPAAMTFLNQEYGRAWPTDSNTCQAALQKYGSTAAATLPTLTSWNGNGYDLTATIAAIQTDTSTHTLAYFKTINTCTASATTVAMPVGSTNLSASAADIDGNGASLVYTWSKLRGAGGVTFSSNASISSHTTTASFDTPGTYLVRLGVTDAVLDPNKFGSVTRDLTITVVPDPNRPPVATNQNVTTALNTAKDITLAASDADGNALTYTVVSAPASGTLAGTPPALTYTPVAGFTGTTSFTFKANDGKVDSSSATVTITVGTSTNSTPVAQNQYVTTLEDTPKTITLTGSDADLNPLTYSIVTGPAHGTLSGSAANRSYTPATNYNGSDSFTFTVNDGTATSGLATVVIGISAVNDAPVALAQSLSTLESTALPITLTGTDPEGYAITYQLASSPTHGTLSGVVPNLIYTPTALYDGGDSLSFTVTDSEGVVSVAATVSITISPVNQPPVALNRGVPVAVGSATGVVLDATDADNDPLTYSVLSQPMRGTLTGTAPNLTYTPGAGYNSTDSFTFKVNDGKADSNIATVFLSMGVVSAQVYTECYLWPGGFSGSWPDISSKTPDATRFDSILNISNTGWPAGFTDNFSSRHTGYINVPASGNYTFILSADDNSKLWIDETLVVVEVFPNPGVSAPLHLTAGYHSLRLEYVEYGGENHFTLYWKSSSISQQVVPAGVLFHCLGSTAPLAPANLSATPLDSFVALAWSASPFATSYAVQRSLVAGGAYTTLASGLTTTSYQDSAVVNGSTYYYVVTATGTGGTSFVSNESAATPVAAPVCVNLDYHPSSSIYMNGISSYSASDRGTASRVAPFDYDGINAAATAVNYWNTGSDGTAALASLKNSEGVATSIGVSALLVSHGSSSSLSGGLGSARLLKGGVTLSQSPNLLSYKTLFKLSGLDTTHNYQLALASQSGTTSTSATYRVGPVQQMVAGGGAASDWRNGLNYGLLDGLIPNSAGEIHVQAMLNTTSATLNGWQLIDRGVRTAAANAYTTIDTCSFGALGAATITDSNISITVPSGTAISALTPTFVAAVGSTITPSTAQNFANTVTYRVRAENGTAYQDYTVRIIVAPNVVFSNTVLAITAASSGAEILSTGTLIAANHTGTSAVAPITLANGLVFGTSVAQMTSGWYASNQRTDTDAHGKVPLLTDATGFGKFMRSYTWTSSSAEYLDIPGLTPGHSYRLQLITPNPANCSVVVEGAAPVIWPGSQPSLLTAIWTAGDSTANIVLTRYINEMEIHGYALHDVTPGFQPCPTGLTAVAGDGQIALSWNAVPGATNYTIKRSLTAGGPYTTLGNELGTSAIDTSLANGTRYYYVISVSTALGESSDSGQASALPVLPPAPTSPPANLVATAGINSVGLIWTAVSGASGYNVKRSLVSGGPYAMVGAVGGTGYTDVMAASGTTYYYVVSATNSGGESNNSGQVSATPISLVTAWRSEHFTPAEITSGLAADGADPDGDGLSNFVEYTLGTDPHGFTPPPLMVARATGNSFTLSFVARAATGTGYGGCTRKYDLETSSDLSNPTSWQGAPGYINIVGGGQTITLTLPATAGKIFYRLNVRVE